VGPHSPLYQQTYLTLHPVGDPKVFFAGCERAVAGELHSLQQDPDVAWFMDAVQSPSHHTPHHTTPHHTTPHHKNAATTNLVNLLPK